MLLLLLLQNVIDSLPNEPAFLFMLAQEKLTAAQQRQVEQMCQASEELSIAYELSQDFVALFKEHKAQAWKRLVETNQREQYQRTEKSRQEHTAGLRRD